MNKGKNIRVTVDFIFDEEQDVKTVEFVIDKLLPQIPFLGRYVVNGLVLPPRMNPMQIVKIEDGRISKVDEIPGIGKVSGIYPDTSDDKQKP